MYAVETPSSDPIASIRGLHWTSPLEAFYDDAVFNLQGELMQTEPVAGTGDDGVVDTYTVEAPVLNDGKMDALIEYIAKNSDIATDLPVLTLRFGNVHAAEGESRHIYGGYILRADNATGQYAVEKF